LSIRADFSEVCGVYIGFGIISSLRKEGTESNDED